MLKAAYVLKGRAPEFFTTVRLLLANVWSQEKEMDQMGREITQLMDLVLS